MQKKAFIIAQSPSESASRDFWKMVYDMKCGVIVNLNHLEEIGEVATMTATGLRHSYNILYPSNVCLCNL